MPEISRATDYDNFVSDTLARMPAYEAAVWPIINQLTFDDLRQKTTIHPDGFLKFYPFGANTETAGAEGQIRLHFWLPEETGVRGPHSHPFDLASRVMVGQYSEVMPTVRQDQNGTWKRFFVGYDGPSLRRAAMGECEGNLSADIGTATVTSEGSDHYMPAGPYHASARQIGVHGITLAIMSARRQPRAHFLVPAERDPEPLAPLQPSGEELERAWDMIRHIRSA